MKNGLGGYFQGELAWEVKRRLNATESKRLDRLLRDLEFWSMPPRDPQIGLDGTTFLLEGIRAGRYHLVERWSPGEGPFADFGEYLRVVSGAKNYLLSLRAQQLKAQAFQKVADASKVLHPEPLTAQAVNRLNKIALKLAERIPSRRLCCPHCQTSTHEILFIEKSHPNKSFFICKLCARSFYPEQVRTLKLLGSRARKI